MILILILIIIASIILALVVLIQNPKGGGLTGSIAGLSNQFMGVKQTTDVLEKTTWFVAAAIGILCILSSFFVTGGTTTNPDIINKSKNLTVPQGAAPQATPNNTLNLGDSLGR